MIRKERFSFLVILIVILLELTATALLKVDPNCITYYKSILYDEQCYECKEFYQLQPDGTCLPCNSRQYFSSGHCKYVSEDCELFDTKTGLCILCISGFSVTREGKCIASPVVDPHCAQTERITGECIHCDIRYQLQGQTCVKCSDRQYKLDGRCTDASLLCDTFNEVTGNCLTCKEVTRVVINGACIAPTWCKSGEYYTPNGCQTVNPQCDGYNPANGDCLTCKDPTQIVVNGNCTCGPNQYYSSGKGCQNISPLCENFNLAYGVCLSCKDKTQIVSGADCVSPPTCGERQYYSKLFKMCLNVQLLCDTFDPSNGYCLTCKDKTMIVIGGNCTSANCAPRKYYTPGGCRDVNPLCGTFDMMNGNCLTCTNPSQVVINGNCTEATSNCGPRQYSTSAGCKDVSSFCDTFDPTNGRCLTCKLQSMAIIDGVCRQCGPRQFVLNGKCANVSEFCETWNTANGGCLSCKDSTQTAVNGVCTSGSPCLTFKENDPNYCLGCRSALQAPVSGICTCDPAKAYLSPFGFCQALFQFCVKMDPMGVSCIVCKASFTLNIFGQCVCPNGAIVNGVICTPHPHCLKVDPSSSLCIVCEPNFTLTAEAECVEVPASKECPEGTSRVGGECVPLPANCLQVDPTNELCIVCAAGFTLTNGQCIRQSCEWGTEPSPTNGLECVPVLCPAGQVLTKDGQHCFPMPPYCLEFNSFLSRCERCDESHVLVNFVCTAISSLERLSHCGNVDKITALCIDCEAGWLKDSLGVCSVRDQSLGGSDSKAGCSSDQYSVGGVCITKPPHCLALDSSGLCNQCEPNYSLQGYLCEQTVSCPAGQTLNAEGACVTLTLNCLTYDDRGNCQYCPNGQPPAYGICCPNGMVNVGGQCSRQSPSPLTLTTHGPACLKYHPMSGNCIECSEGGSVDPADPMMCI